MNRKRKRKEERKKLSCGIRDRKTATINSGKFNSIFIRFEFNDKAFW